MVKVFIALNFIRFLLLPKHITKNVVTFKETKHCFVVLRVRKLRPVSWAKVKVLAVPCTFKKLQVGIQFFAFSSF